MDKDKEVTILMPVYNSEKHIRSSIQSILKQSYKKFKLFIIYDESSDNTLNIIKEFNDKRIRLFINKRLGLIESLNFGILKTESEYIARMDSDDLSHPKRIEQQIKLLENSNADICGCNYFTINKKSIILQNYELPIDQKDLHIKIASNVPFCHGSLVAKTKIFKKFNYGSGENNIVEDYYLWTKMIRNGITFTNVKEYLYYLRVHPNSRSNKNNNFKIYANNAIDSFIKKESDFLIEIFKSKTLLDFISMPLISVVRDYLLIFKKLKTIKKIDSSLKMDIALLILRIKSKIYLILFVLKRIYFCLFQKIALKKQ